jgi:hypothetical protein
MVEASIIRGATHVVRRPIAILGSQVIEASIIRGPSTS